MKKLNYLILLAGLLLFAACTKGTKECCTPPLCCAMGFAVKAQIGDTTWIGEPTVTLRTDTITIRGTHGEENLVFNLKFRGQGSYKLDSTNTTFYTTVGGDVVSSSYKATNDATNVLNISTYDPNTAYIAGTFDCILKLEQRTDTSTVKIHLTNGSMRLGLSK